MRLAFDDASFRTRTARGFRPIALITLLMATMVAGAALCGADAGSAGLYIIAAPSVSALLIAAALLIRDFMKACAAVLTVR